MFLFSKLKKIGIEITYVSKDMKEIHWKSEKFLRKPKRILLYDSQKQQVKYFRSHLQGLAFWNLEKFYLMKR